MSDFAAFVMLLTAYGLIAVFIIGIAKILGLW